jgi:voltage-gated potassium channel
VAQDQPPSWADLDRRQRRREIIHTLIESTLTWALLLGIYYLVPFTDRTSAGSLVRLALGIAAFVVVLAWQLHRITHADLPGLRAVQALAIIIPLFLVIFAVLYLSLSQASSTHFSEPLNHTGALYLAITVFSTVGFGDITPKGDLARIVVSIQMILDLVVIGAVVRLITTAAKTGQSGSASRPSPDEDSPASHTDAL